MILQADPTTFNAAAKSLTKGDSLQLTAGDYGARTLAGLSGVTIDASAAAFAYVQINNCTGLTIHGGAFRPIDWHGGVYAYGSTDVTLDAVNVTSERTDGGCVTGRACSGVSLVNSVLVGGMTQVLLLSVTGFKVNRNRFSRFTADAINICDSVDGEVVRNAASDNVVSGAHPDFCQMYSTAAQRPPSRISITDNMVFGDMQGISNFGNLAKPMDRIFVERNTLALSYPSAVAFDYLTNSRIVDNRAITLPGARWATRIEVPRTPDPSNVICGN